MDQDNQDRQGSMQPKDGYQDDDQQWNDFMPYPEDGLASMQAQMNNVVQVFNQLTQNMAQMVQLTTMHVQNQMPQLAPKFQPPFTTGVTIDTTPYTCRATATCTYSVKE